jgi:hypothetical protein
VRNTRLRANSVYLQSGSLAGCAAGQKRRFSFLETLDGLYVIVRPFDVQPVTLYTASLRQVGSYQSCSGVAFANVGTTSPTLPPVLPCHQPASVAHFVAQQRIGSAPHEVHVLAANLCQRHFPGN